MDELLGFFPHLVFRVVDIFANCCHETTQALQIFLIIWFEQAHHAVVHDLFCEHLQFEQLTNKPAKMNRLWESYVWFKHILFMTEHHKGLGRAKRLCFMPIVKNIWELHYVTSRIWQCAFLKSDSLWDNVERTHEYTLRTSHCVSYIFRCYWCKEQIDT